MRLAGFRDFSLTDGEGQRLVIFTTGCIHNCVGCHNSEMQDYEYGEEWSVEDILNYIRQRLKWIDGITLSGGDPLFQLDNTKQLLKAIRKDKELKDLNVWLYTGYLFEDIPNDIRTKVDTIVDGPFLRNRPPARWRGSDNQRIFKSIRRDSKHFTEVYKVKEERLI